MEKNQILQFFNILICVGTVILFIKGMPKSTANEVKKENIVAITNQVDAHNKEVLSKLDLQILVNPTDDFFVLFLVLVLLLILLSFLVSFKKKIIQKKLEKN